MAEYDYASVDDLEQAASVEEAVRLTVVNYFHTQLGWSREKCNKRVEQELARDIPKGLFDKMVSRRDWVLDGASLIDIGAGQGGAMLEALHRGADAYGVEPGPEFAKLARMRIEDAGFDTDRLHKTGGEKLPFPDNHFDYAITLQVLEHVEDPRPLLEEMYRVLKPGGKAAIRCENYLAFREQHYRVPWLPLLPKPLGSLYLRAVGRDPSFLEKYVFYSTYPQIWRLASKVGFKNVTHQHRLEKVRTLNGIKTRSSAIAGEVLRILPRKVRLVLARWVIHVRQVFGVGVSVDLVKPHDTGAL